MLAPQPVRVGPRPSATAKRTSPAGQPLSYNLTRPPVLDPYAARTGAAQDVSNVPQEPVDTSVLPPDVSSPDMTLAPPESGPMAFLTAPVTIAGYDVPTWALIAGGVAIVGGVGYAVYAHNHAAKGGKRTHKNPRHIRLRRRSRRRGRRRAHR